MKKTKPSHHKYLKPLGILPRLHLDQIRLDFFSIFPIPAKTAHTVIRKVMGENTLYGYIFKPADDDERQKAASRSFAIALHDLTQDRKRNVTGISIAQLNTLWEQLSNSSEEKDTVCRPSIEYSEVALDLYEKTPLSNLERAEIAVTLLLNCAKAVGMSKIRGSRNKRERPLTFEHNDRSSVIKHLMTGYSIFTKDKSGRTLKAYIKTHDTKRELNPLTGKMETVALGPLSSHLHRVRIEWTFNDKATPIKKIDDLQDLKQLAEWFYMNIPGTVSNAIKPACSGHRRKKPKNANADTEFNRWIRGAARSFQLPKTKKGAEKIDLNERPTEEKAPTSAPPTLITSEASYLPRAAASAQYELPEDVMKMIEGLTFSSASLSTPVAVHAHLGHESSLQQLGHASPLTFDKGPTGAAHQALN